MDALISAACPETVAALSFRTCAELDMRVDNNCSAHIQCSSVKIACLQLKAYLYIFIAKR